MGHIYQLKLGASLNVSTEKEKESHSSRNGLRPVKKESLTDKDLRTLLIGPQNSTSRSPTCAFNPQGTRSLIAQLLKYSRPGVECGRTKLGRKQPILIPWIRLHRQSYLTILSLGRQISTECTDFFAFPGAPFYFSDRGTLVAGAYFLDYLAGETITWGGLTMGFFFFGLRRYSTEDGLSFSQERNVYSEK